MSLLTASLALALTAQAQESVPTGAQPSSESTRVDISVVADEQGIDATLTVDGVEVESLEVQDGELTVSGAPSAAAEPVVGAASDGAGEHDRAGVFERAAVDRISALEARLAEMEAELAAKDDALSVAEPVPGGDLDREPQDLVSQSGGVVVAAGVTVEDAVSLAGPVDVRGEVLGDAVAMGGGIVVHDGARVHGDAVAFGGPVDVRPGGRVDGDKVAMDGAPSMSAVMGPVGELSNGWMAGLRGLLRRIAMLLSIAGAGVLVVGLWPRQVHQVAEMVRARPFWTSIAGGILVAAFSVGALALTFTFIGIPLAVLLLGVLALAAMLGFVAVCQALGENIPQLREHGSWAAFLAGAALLGLVSLLPWVGPLTLALVGFSAVGAALVTRLGNGMSVVEPAA